MQMMLEKITEVYMDELCNFLSSAMTMEFY